MGLSLAELLDAPVKARSFRVDELLEGSELSPVDRDVFAKAVHDPNVKAGRLEDAMNVLGVTCSGTAITNWRRANGVTR